MDRAKLQAFIEGIGKAARSPGRIYLVGGASALLLDIRDQTIDVDIKMEPEPGGVFESIARLKEQLGINVELASPDGFFPPLPGWQERSEFIARSGFVDFYHYDFYAQVLSKVLRGHTKDRSDAEAFVRHGKVDLGRLWTLFESVRSEMIRYPAVDPVNFEERLRRFIREVQDDRSI